MSNIVLGITGTSNASTELKFSDGGGGVFGLSASNITEKLETNLDYFFFFNNVKHVLFSLTSLETTTHELELLEDDVDLDFRSELCDRLLCLLYCRLLVLVESGREE